jgi:ATP-dependent protease ClpP protease subunit
MTIFALFLVAIGSGGGSLASAVAIAKLVKAVTIPDPIVETVIGTAAFFGGVVAIIVLISFLIGSMMPRIT